MLPDRTILGKAPLIIFVGPASCGKSMVLMSLVEYLRNTVKNYVVTPNYEYISDDSYKDKCDKFMSTLEKNVGKGDGYKEALDSTVDEILVDVRERKQGPVKFRMLEAPGEDFFSIKEPANPYAEYLNEIISKTRKEQYPVYYVMLLDIHTKHSDDKEFSDIHNEKRGAYESRLIDFFHNGYDHSRGDKVVLLYNKIDLVENKEEAIDQVLTSYYPNLKHYFKYRFGVFFNIPAYIDILPYKTGRWRNDVDHEGNSISQYKSDAESEDYARKLWKALTSKF